MVQLVLIRFLRIQYGWHVDYPLWLLSTGLCFFLIGLALFLGFFLVLIIPSLHFALQQDLYMYLVLSFIVGCCAVLLLILAAIISACLSKYLCTSAYVDMCRLFTFEDEVDEIVRISPDPQLNSPRNLVESA